MEAEFIQRPAVEKWLAARGCRDLAFAPKDEDSPEAAFETVVRCHDCDGVAVVVLILEEGGAVLVSTVKRVEALFSPDEEEEEEPPRKLLLVGSKMTDRAAVALKNLSIEFEDVEFVSRLILVVDPTKNRFSPISQRVLPEEEVKKLKWNPRELPAILDTDPQCMYYGHTRIGSVIESVISTPVGLTRTYRVVVSHLAQR